MEQALTTLLGVFMAALCFLSIAAYKNEIKQALPNNSNKTHSYSNLLRPTQNRAQRRAMKIP